MKILQVISKFYQSGAENLVYNLSPLFTKRGHTVHVLALYKNENQREESELMEGLKSRGVITSSIGGDKQARFHIVRELQKYIKSNGIEIIHSHAYQPNFYSRIASMLTSVPVVVTYHSASNDWRHEKSRWAEKLVDPISAARVSVSRIPMDFYRSRISKKNEVSLVPNGIVLSDYIGDDTKRETILNSMGISPDKRIFLNVGRIVKQKGQIHLISAAGLLKQSGVENFSVIVAGQYQDVELLKELKQLISQYDLGECVHLLGSRNDVDDLLFASDFFIFPSVAEAHPIALIEAAFFEKPIIASAIQANTLAFSENSVFFTEPGNSKDLANMMVYVIENNEVAKEKSLNAKQEACSKYDIKDTVKSYESIYHSVI